MEKENAAMESRYAEWFNAFIQNSNENERQKEAVNLLLSRLKEKVPSAFNSKSGESTTFVDLMCGPGDMTLGYKQALQNIDLKNVQAIGVELRDDHVESWKSKLGQDDIIIKGDVGDKDFDINKLAGTEGNKKPVAIFWGHGGYYLYKSKLGEEKGSEQEIGVQPSLDNVVSLIHKTLGENGIAVSVHKSAEWTDIPKKRFSKLVESHTTDALEKSYEKQNIKHQAITFECELKTPEMTPNIKRQLSGERIEEYNKMQSGDTKTTRQILEFLIHTPLEELGKDLFDLISKSKDNYQEFIEKYPSGDMPVTRSQYNGIKNGHTTFNEFNHQKRKEYISYIDDLSKKHKGVIPTYVKFDVSVSKEASPEFADAVLATVRELDSEIGKKINLPDFLQVKREIESKVVGMEQLELEKKRAAVRG
ncbi:MAG: hypothetical protein R3D71_06620 [Rickettsiales bacterium]